MDTQRDDCRCLELVGQVLIRCFWGGVILTLVWFVFCILLGDWVYSVHGSMNSMTRQQFDVTHYCGIAALMTGTFTLFLLPYLSIRLVLKKNR